MDLNPTIKVKIIEIHMKLFQREIHAINDLLKHRFQAVDGYTSGQEASFLCLAEKDDELFRFIVTKNEDTAEAIVDSLSPLQASKANVHDARFSGIEDKWFLSELKSQIPSGMDINTLLSKKLIKVRIFDEPFYLFNTYDASKLIF